MIKASIIVNNEQERDEWLDLHGYPVDDGEEIYIYCRCGEAIGSKHVKYATRETTRIAICADCADK